MTTFRAALISLALAAAGQAADPAGLPAAVDLYRQRNPEARAAFEQLAAGHPEHAGIQFYLGRLALQRGEQELAVKYLEKAVALAPNESRHHHRLGDAYGLSAQKAGFIARIGFANKCRVAYEKAVELDPASVDARLGLLGFYQQAPSVVGGGLDKAYLQAAEIKKLDAARGRFALAMLYAAEKKHSEAFAEFESALKENADDYGALFQVGRLAAISGERLDRGLECLRRCLALPSPEGQPGHAAAHWRIGNILEKQNDKTGARTAYEAALKSDPKFPQAIESLNKL